MAVDLRCYGTSVLRLRQSNRSPLPVGGARKSAIRVEGKSARVGGAQLPEWKIQSYGQGDRMCLQSNSPHPRVTSRPHAIDVEQIEPANS